MIRLKLIIVLAFAIIFVAGLAVGSFVDLNPHPAVTVAPPVPKKSASHFPNFLEQLGLTSTQDAQVEKLWHDAHTHNETLAHQFRDIDRQSDEAVINLLTPEQKVAYDKIQHERHERVEALRGEMVTTMKDANQCIRALLTPDQQKKFDELSKQYGPPHTPGGPHFRNHHGTPPDSNPARPETGPS